MFIQGDVLAFLALLLGSCISAWSLTLAYGLLFPEKCQVAKTVVTEKPWRCLGTGALLTLTIGLIGLGLIGQAPNPVLKLIGWVLVLGLFGVSSLGLAGISLNAADRLKVMSPDMTPYAAFTRGAGFLIMGCIFPIVGWLAVAPLLWLTAMGAGVKALRTRTEGRVVIQQTETA